MQTSRIPAPRADALDEELSRMAVAGKPSLIPPPKVVAQHGSTNAPARGKMAGAQGGAGTGTKKGTGKMSGGRAAAPGKQQGAAGTIGAFDHVQVGVPGGAGVAGGSENIMNLVPQDDNNVTITNFGGAGGAPAATGQHVPPLGPHQSNPYQQHGQGAPPVRYNDVAPAAQPGPLNNYHPATSSTSNPYGSPSGVGNNQNYLSTRNKVLTCRVFFAADGREDERFRLWRIVHAMQYEECCTMCRPHITISAPYNYSLTLFSVILSGEQPFVPTRPVSAAAARLW